MSSSTSSRSTLTITPSTMSPSLKYLMVWSIAARKSSAVPMSLTAIWGVLSGRTWVEVIWSIAPDGECVGTGRPAAGTTAGRAGRAGGRRSPDPGHNADRPLAHSHRTDVAGGRSTWVFRPGPARGVSPWACHERFPAAGRRAAPRYRRVPGGERGGSPPGRSCRVGPGEPAVVGRRRGRLPRRARPRPGRRRLPLVPGGPPRGRRPSARRRHRPTRARDRLRLGAVLTLAAAGRRAAGGPRPLRWDAGPRGRAQPRHRAVRAAPAGRRRGAAAGRRRRRPRLFGVRRAALRRRRRRRAGRGREGAAAG